MGSRECGAAAEYEIERRGIDRCQDADRANNMVILGDRRSARQTKEVDNRPEVGGQITAQPSAPSSCSEACG